MGKKKFIIVGAVGVLLLGGVAVVTALQFSQRGLLPFAPTAPGEAPAYTITELADVAGFSAQFDEFWEEGLDTSQWQFNVNPMSAVMAQVADEKLLLRYPNEPIFAGVTEKYPELYAYTKLRIRDNFSIDVTVSDLTSGSGRAAVELWSNNDQEVLVSMGWEKASGESRVRGLVFKQGQVVVETPTAAVEGNEVALRISRINGVLQFFFIVDNQVKQVGEAYVDVYDGTGAIRLSVTPLTSGEPVEAKFDNLLGTINVE